MIGSPPSVHHCYGRKLREGGEAGICGRQIWSRLINGHPKCMTFEFGNKFSQLALSASLNLKTIFLNASSKNSSLRAKFKFDFRLKLKSKLPENVL
ncbi:hypothetical protein CEXT_165861 [Caerostris extrusa]|uniref:Uncharacterized protein n=1 Tax=Caerostris extrusa TaxID=172846 RepID=A0AAV4MC73_CAEEX|nr:hypothetical protein CEXT_165861 [Caerostris extrusa]